MEPADCIRGKAQRVLDVVLQPRLGTLEIGLGGTDRINGDLRAIKPRSAINQGRIAARGDIGHHRTHCLDVRLQIVLGAHQQLGVGILLQLVQSQHSRF